MLSGEVAVSSSILARVALVTTVALAYGLTWWRVRRRCFPEFRARLYGRVTALLGGLPLLAWRSGSWRIAISVLGLAIVSAWISSRGRPERFFPRRWFHATGTAPPWLSWLEILVFWALFAAGCYGVYYRWT